ncbi:MAG: hypothetical protein KDM64_07950 [Verrucomicrobiae bacterium]|nr:hypothetical protein [Verrucomicrobiae bacterium]
MKRLLTAWRQFPFWPRWTALTGLGLVIAWLGYDFYGRRQWAEFVERYNVPGTTLDFEQVREKQRAEKGTPHFLHTPSMRKWESRNPDHDPAFTDLLTKFPTGITIPIYPPGRAFGWRTGEISSLGAFLAEAAPGTVSEAEAARILRSALASSDGAIAELCHDATVPGRPWLQEIPNISAINDFARLLSLRIRVAISNNDGERALEELLCSLRFSERLRESESLIGMLIQLYVLETLEDAIWEGIECGIWEEKELGQLALKLEKLTITRDYSKVALCEIGTVRDSIRETETIFGSWRWFCVKSLKEEFSPLKIFDLASHNWKGATWSFCEIVLPEGHRRNGFAQYGKFWESSGLCPPDAAGSFPEFSVELLDLPFYRPHPIFAIAAPHLGRVGETLLTRQQFVDLARLACEVRRFQLQEGRFPMALTELHLDTTIPRDRFQPTLLVRYRVNADQTEFSLIASGPDRTDDGGNRDTDFVFSSSATSKVSK